MTASPLDLLTAIWGDGWHSLCSGTGKNKSFRVDGAFDDPDALLDRAAELNAQRRSVWFEFHPMDSKPETRGSAADVSKVWAFPADLDWLAPAAHADGRLPTEAAVRSRLATFAIPPSVIICSGHGLQPWWLLDAPIDAATGSNLIGRLHAALTKDGLVTDRADLASILRVPGSLNWKTAEPAQVTTEFADLSKRWVPEYLDKHLAGNGTRKGSRKSGNKGPITAGLVDALARLRDDNRDQDADALEVICAHHGGHHPYIGRDGHIYVTRPDKNAGTSASIGVSGPGIAYIFTPSWPPFKEHGHYVVNETGDSMESTDDDRRPDQDRDHDGETGDREIPVSWSDAHVGETFGATLTGRWLYCRALGGWLRWDGQRWIADPGEGVHEEFRRWIIDLGDKVWHATGDGDEMKKVARYRERGKIDAAVTIARRLDQIAAAANEFDRHPHLLNATNGVIDLRAGTLSPHDPGLRLTKMAGGAYRPDAKHKDLDTILDALEPDVRQWVQRLFGSAAYGEVVDDVLAVFDGAGSNGKTTILKAASSALGEYAAPATTRLLISRATHDEHPTLLADLFGRRLVYIEETPEGGSLKMEQVKSITGGGKLKARFIGRDYFEFEPSHQLIVATNHRPAVNASDYAAWRRLRLVPFPHTYRLPHEAKPGDRVADRNLRTRLAHPAQREAMLAWIVAGAVAWHTEHGLGGCEAVDAASAAWRRDEDIVHAWWSDRLTPGGSTPAAALYRSFVDWCTQEGRRFVSSNKEFAKRLTDHDLYREHHIDKRNTMAGTVYFGVSMVDMEGVPAVLSRSIPRGNDPTPTISTMTSGLVTVVEGAEATYLQAPVLDFCLMCSLHTVDPFTAICGNPKCEF